MLTVDKRGQSISTVATDFIVVVLPLPTLLRLQLPFLQRLALLILFSFGFVVVLAGCMRAYWSHHVVYETYDVSWEGFHLWIWTAVEANLGVICGCVPALRPLFRTKGSTGARSSAGARSGATPKAVSGTFRRSGKSWTENSPHARLDDIDEAERGKYVADAYRTIDTPAAAALEMSEWPLKKNGHDSEQEFDYEHRPQEMAGPLSR